MENAYLLSDAISNTIAVIILFYLLRRLNKRIDKLEDIVTTHSCNCKTFGVELDVLKEQLKQK